MTNDTQNYYLPHEKQIFEYIKTIEHLKKQNQDNPLFCSEIRQLEDKLHKLQKNVYSALTPWERVLISRHPQRPHTIDYVKNIAENFVELFGDRTQGDDPSIIGGFATIGGVKCMLIGQEKGGDTESRVQRNFGMVNPEGFRKAMRLMKLAEKYGLPIVSLLDTPGAYPGLEAEQRGQGWIIAKNLQEMSQLATPVIVLIIGEGCSGGALGMGVGDVIGMLEHSYYSVISPEGCASILWKDASKKQDAAAALKLNAEFLHDAGIIDEILVEPLGGAHHDTEAVYSVVKKFIVDQCAILGRISPELLLEQRYNKFRTIGRYNEHQKLLYNHA
ncbi:MAG: acetyl-CoA carboxylase carboxyltransferase subunit alpha [Verrucomicrobia bacterium]|nr:acetyl-CoA carboxylase carboxyltransferase subunit alpha [Verrucomicrobiota bacterium]MBS0636697.1 acetyl-CoA carboxylase carboxyltransferase subunit alpha [Verrucomicrobiota bacterium]